MSVDRVLSELKKVLVPPNSGVEGLEQSAYEEWLMVRQNILQQEACRIFNFLGLKEFFSLYGEASLTGSAKLGLMVHPDIDTLVEVKKRVSVRELAEIAGYLLAQPFIRKVCLVDHRCVNHGVAKRIVWDAEVDKKKPITATCWRWERGVYMGACYQEGIQNVEWNLDFWFRERAHGCADSSWIKEYLTEEKKRIILRLKAEVGFIPREKKGFSSLDLYKAVLLGGVMTPEGLYEYLKEDKFFLFK